MKKTLLQIVLTLAIVAAGYLLYSSLSAPLVFGDHLATRSKEIVQKLKDIRTIERAYKQKYGAYTDDYEELKRFIKNDSLVFIIASGSEDDSVAVAQGLVTQHEVLLAAKDTLFKGRTINFDEIDLIPFTNGEKFQLGVANLATESGVEVNVFEAKAEYKLFLADLESFKQDVINLYDRRKTEDKYPGLKVGSLEKANNDAGNWED